MVKDKKDKKVHYTFEIFDKDENMWYSQEYYIQAKKFLALQHAETLYLQWFHSINSEEEYDRFITSLMFRYVVQEKDVEKKTFNELVFRILDFLFTNEYKNKNTY